MRLRSSHTAPIALVVAVALLGLFAAGNDASAASFNPAINATLSSPVAGANSDLVITLSVPRPDAYFSAIITFIPAAEGIGTCPANAPASAARSCADGTTPDGALVGHVDATATLGLLNAACSNGLELKFEMQDATTEMSPTVIFKDDPADADKVGEQFEDDNSDGVPNGVQMYPAYLTRLLMDIPFGVPGGHPLQPIQRMYGQTPVAGDWVSLQFVIFPPGIMINGLQLDPANGFPVVTVLQDSKDPGAIPDPAAITDNCTPLSSTTTTFGTTRDNPDTTANEGGITHLTNPTAGGYGLGHFLVSEYDDDDDGIENTLDTCPTSGNPDNFDPRNPDSPGDNDKDGIPNVCDPTPDENLNTGDQDGDGFPNRGDNCPIVANADQADADRDGLGNVCDPNPAAPSAHKHVVKGFSPAMIAAAINGDADCSGDISAVDALQVLRHVALLQPRAACVLVAGNADCGGGIDSVDALQVLRFVAHLLPVQDPGCPAIGAPLA